MSAQLYYTFDYDEVVPIYGYYDSLYGCVSIDDGFGHTIKSLLMNEQIWRTPAAAEEALVEDCKKQLDKASSRNQEHFRETKIRRLI